MTQEERVREFVAAFERLRSEVEKVIVGHRDIINHVLIGMFAGGHVLLEGAPGLGKTLLIKTLAEGLELSFSRVQVTPDLMPADIIGTNIILEDSEGRKHFEFQPGPIFGHILLADEINRATPKTQSALLEGMQEGFATAAVAVLRARHPEPDRDGRHVSAARGAARPVPVQAARALPGRRGAQRHHRPDDPGPAGGGRAGDDRADRARLPGADPRSPHRLARAGLRLDDRDGDASRMGRSPGGYSTVHPLRCQPAWRPGPGARRQGLGPFPGALQRQRRRYPRADGTGPAAPRDPELRG